MERSGAVPRTSAVPWWRGARWRRFRFPVLFVPLLAAMLAVSAITPLLAPLPVVELPVGLGLAVAAVAAYRGLVRLAEGRDVVVELASRTRWTGLGRGALLGFWLFCTTLVVIGLLGGWGVVSWGTVTGLVGPVGTMAAVATTEELVFRGVLFRVMEERTGTVVAIAVSSSLFGLVHLADSGTTLWGAPAVAGGALLAAAYVATRSLWFPIGLHFGWIFAQAGIFGVEASGTDAGPAGLLVLELSGAATLTGGPFGPEASPVTLVVCLVATAVLIGQAACTARIRPRPRWS